MACLSRGNGIGGAEERAGAGMPLWNSAKDFKERYRLSLRPQSSPGSINIVNGLGVATE
jgi:hypothetical protein